MTAAWLQGLEEEDPDGLRYYQRAAYDAVRESLKENRSALAVMATGLGKTQLFCALAAHWPGNVLVLAHRQELVGQARQRMEQMTGEFVEVEQADFRSYQGRIVVGSVDTVKQKKRLERLGKDRFSLIIADEAHHYVAKTYRRPLDFFADAKILGVTATPDRADEKALGAIFEDVPVVYDIQEGIEMGYLVPITGRRVHLDEIDLTKVRRSGKDLNQSELDEAMVKAVEGICQKTIELEPDRQGLCFFPGVRSAEYATERFNLLRPDSAVCITAKTHELDRKRWVRDFKEGRIQYLCNVQVATEGFDAPDASMVVQARPTKSRALYAQMVGRGTRVLPLTVDHILGEEGAEQRRAAVAASAKPECVILDFVGNAGKHDLATVEDVLGGNYTPAEVKTAKKKAEREGGGDTLAFLNQARAELKAMAAAIDRATVKARVESFDPFKTMHMDRPSARFGDSPPSPKQRAMLEKAGVPTAGLSKREASKMIANVFKRRELGLATFKQLRTLQKHGVTKVNISFRAASEAIDYLAQSGWRDYDAERLHQIVG